MLKRLVKDRRGTIAVITAIVIFPLLFLAVGVPIDLARAIQYRALLQDTADVASLAGSEVLADGANPLQACTLANAYVNVAINNGELPGSPTPSATLTSPGADSYPCASATSTPEITNATAPNEVTMTIAGAEATTFLSFIRSSIAVSVSSSAIGPADFITICVKPQPNYSGDLSQSYYYLRNTDGSLVNEDGTTVEPSSAGIYPGDTGGVELSEFLGDDAYVNEHPPQTQYTNGYCDAADTVVAVPVKTGLAQRLGFAYYVVTNGQAPCTAVFPKLNLNGHNLSDFSCLKGDQNYAYNPYEYATNIQGYFPYYQQNAATNPSTGKPYLFLPNAYGSPVGWVNAFFSTDYPASLNSNNYYVNDAGTVVSPVAGDSCFTTYQSATSNTVKSVVNGYTGASQSCLSNESSSTKNKALSVQAGQTVQPSCCAGGQSNVIYWSSVSDTANGLSTIGGSTNTGTDLVCMVANGQADTTLTETNKGTYSIANVTNTGDQQENLVIANSSVAPNVYRCPVHTIGNPFYPDPTCSELNGATLQIGWNDMGGILYDNGNYVDLHYSYSCEAPAAQAIITSALIQ